jgi:hypothetical protein
MNEQRIREIANQASTHAEDTVDYYSGIVDGLTWEAKILKARDLKFAELIVRECASQLDDGAEDGMWVRGVLYRHFGVEDK